MSSPEWVYPYKLGIVLPKNFKYKNTILVLGDSFAELGMLDSISTDKDHTSFSWMNHLSHSLRCNIKSLGMSAGAEQVTYEIFKKSLNIDRCYTIIVHTEYRRDDIFTAKKLARLELKDYKEWDSLLNPKTLHIYWHKNHLHYYNFKKGKTLLCNYWDKKKTNYDYQLSINPDTAGANHMTYYGNLLLTKDIVETIGEDLGT